MTKLEYKIYEFLIDLEKILVPRLSYQRKIQLVNDKRREVLNFIDIDMSAFRTYSDSFGSILKLSSANFAMKCLEEDDIFGSASESIHAWCNLNYLIPFLISRTAKLTKNKIFYKHMLAIDMFRKYRANVSNPYLEFDASTRFVGAMITSNCLLLPENVVIHRLTKKKLNNAQPGINANFLGIDQFDYLNQVSELRVKFKIPFDYKLANSYSLARKAAEIHANEVFSRILNSTLIAVRGKVILGHLELKSNIDQLYMSRPIIQNNHLSTNLIINSRNLKDIHLIHNLLNNSDKQDNVISRSFRRFLSGRQRENLIDQLVDYVVAWETILLTQNNSSLNQEMSYRFAINGASLISKIINRHIHIELHKKFRCAYSIRSSITHGSDKKQFGKILKSADFNSLEDVCIFLELNYKRTLIWLESVKPNNRPYKIEDGWETIIWQ